MAGESLVKRQRLFDLFVAQPGHELLTQGTYFHCPLCRRAFVRDQTGGDEPALTLAHIISKSLGGSWETLTCKECNNDNGCAIEADLLASHRITDWIAGRGQMKVRMGESGIVTASLSRGPDGAAFHFDIHTPMQNPAVLELRDQIEDSLTDPQGGRGFPLRMSLARGEWCRAAVCQSAYLLMFQYFGYDFARDDTYETLRQQVLNPNERIWTGNIGVLNEATAAEILQGQQAAVAFTREPNAAILAVLRFGLRGGIPRVLAVVLPGPGGPHIVKAEIQTFTPAVVPYEPEFMGTTSGFFRWRWHRWITEHQ